MATGCRCLMHCSEIREAVIEEGRKGRLLMARCKGCCECIERESKYPCHKCKKKKEDK